MGESEGRWLRENEKKKAKNDNWRFCWMGAENKGGWQRERTRNLSTFHPLLSFVCWFLCPAIVSPKLSGSSEAAAHTGK